MNLKILFLATSLLLLLACTNGNKDIQLDFLTGTWKVADKEQYEVWEKQSSDHYTGYGYTQEDGEKFITETISIRKADGQWVFEATVPDQNEGKTIAFLLNQQEEEWFSFENEAHDFPKKIQYRKIATDELMVQVLGANDEGFSFTMIKQ